jgi:hypothetical protein
MRRSRRELLWPRASREQDADLPELTDLPLWLREDQHCDHAEGEQQQRVEAHNERTGDVNFVVLLFGRLGEPTVGGSG